MTCLSTITTKSMNTQRNGSETSSTQASSRQELSTPVQLSMFSPVTSQASDAATSSPASEDGRSPCTSPDGQRTVLSGPAPAPANRSPSPENEKALLTSDTSGPNFDALSRSDALQSSLESRLRERLRGSGSCEVIWSKWDTPWGQSRLRPRARTRTISGTDIGLWPTCTVHGNYNRKGASPHSGDGLHTLVFACWSTLRASDGEKGGPNMSFGAGGCPLPSQVSTVANTSNAPMENGGGSLHPEFAGWEMGYPPAWLSCAPSAMPSIRALERSSSAPISNAGLEAPLDA
ncbi:MAG: hypothetical protein RL492_1762 [Verrucomicrobiota bacterium]